MEDLCVFECWNLRSVHRFEHTMFALEFQNILDENKDKDPRHLFISIKNMSNCNNCILNTVYEQC